MKKQLLSILGIFILMLAVGNVMGQSSEPPAELGDDDEINTPIDGGFTRTSKYLSFIHHFANRNTIVTPTNVVVTEEYIVNGEDLLQTETKVYDSFEYDEIDFNLGIAKKAISSFYWGEYSFYKLTITGRMEGVLFRLVYEMPEEVANPVVVNFSIGVNKVEPNPFYDQIGIVYSISKNATYISFRLLDERGNVLLFKEILPSTMMQLVIAQGTHTYSITDPVLLGLPPGKYFLSIVGRDEYQRTDTKTVQLFKG